MATTNTNTTISLKTVSDNISINRYNNGWMVEIGGNDKKDDWATEKIVCTTEEQLIALIKNYNTMPLQK